MNERHGLSGTTEHNIWMSMRQRCNDVNYPAYKDYGGRGITVCDRWNNSFLNFLEDMGKRPDKLTLERINNNEGYSPENCKWDTRKNQRDNQRMMVVLPAHSMSNITQDCRTVDNPNRKDRWEVRMRIFKRKRIIQSFTSLDDAKDFRDDIIYEKFFHRQLGLH